MVKSKHHLPWYSRAWHRLTAARTDWRFLSVAVAAALAVAVTGLVYACFPQLSQPSNFWGAFFASWVAGVALFFVVGSIVAFASLARPEDESPETRARILFRRQSGRHIDYILTKIGGSFEPYVENSAKRYAVKEYNEAEKKFRVISQSRSVVRGYIDDMNATYKSAVQYRDATPPPRGKPSSKMSYLRIDGEPDSEGGQEFGDILNHPFDTSVPRHGSCVVEYELDYWIREAEEPNRLSTTRYTQKHELVVENHLIGRSIKVSFAPKHGEEKEFFIKPGESRSVYQTSEFEPETHIYDFRIHAV